MSIALSIGVPLSVFLHSFLLLWVHALGNSMNVTKISIDEDLIHRLMNGPDELHFMDYVLFGVLILLALELLNLLVLKTCSFLHVDNIPVRGKHLDELREIDQLFIRLNKAANPPFVYFLVRYMYYEPNSVWNISEGALRNVLLPLPFIYIIYDFFYTILHWGLHKKSIYRFIHKHHHTQKAPSRGNVDAVNVHPIEYFLGEYNHLFAVFIWCRCFNFKLHFLAIVLFLLLGGILTSLNHTRFNVFIFCGITIYDSKYHDVHHRIPQSNYGQYIMLWDHIFGTFRPYDENQKFNPKSQLDPKTGKSFEYMKRHGKSK